MATPYTYPTDSMLAAVIAGNRGARGAQTQLGYDQEPLPMSAPVGGFKGVRIALAHWIAGADSGLFPPQQPLQPMAQRFDEGALGRSWDYPAGLNTRVTPRSGEPVTFAQLKNLASYDVLRILIERVKEEITSQDWTIGPKDEKVARDARSDDLTKFFEKPDRKHNWCDWLKMLLDQMLVYDTPAIWLRPTRGGDLYGLTIFDGTLISPKITSDGRPPEPEEGPAYQKVIKGLPAVDYIQPVVRGQPIPVDPYGQPYPELLYSPRNPRVNSLYGFSVVEQIITTINIALKREEYLLAYYTEGNTPDLLLGVPENWNPAQIEYMQNTFDAMLAGNLEMRRKARFIPGGVKPYDVHEKALTDEADQWLIRIMCFCLGLSPMPFIKMMNRASGEQHAEQQKEEGALPYLRWVRDLINGVIELKFGYDDIVFRWREEDSTSAVEQATIDSSDVQAGIYHPDEIRANRGDEPMSAEYREQMAMANYRNAPNATLLTDAQQTAQDERDAAYAAANPAPAVAGNVGKGGAGKSGHSTRTARLY